MTGLNAYLIFHGHCADAMRFYQQKLGGELVMQTHADNFPRAQAGANADRIIHARLEIPGGNLLMASDDMAGDSYAGMEGFMVCLLYTSAAEARHTYDALLDGGKVTMPFEKTFFSEGFGMLRDRFGTPWMVNTVAVG